MTHDPSLFTKRIRHLSLALVVSGVLNIGVLSLFLYWVLRERPPTPYCELKPASSEQQQIPLADQRGCAQVLTQLAQLSFPELVNSLSHTQVIEDGYAERDLALACLMAFHHFDLPRALPKNAQPQQRRLLAWRPKGQESAITLVVYPDLTQQQFDALIQFAKTERWPLTAEGLFLQLKDQKEKVVDDHLVETFVLTPEFWTVELLFNRSGQRASKQDILTVLLEGNWDLLKQFVDQQRQLHDSSDARRQKFLLDYVKAGAFSAATLLLKTEWEFAVKKLDDQQVLTILLLTPGDSAEGLLFAKEMLASPRSTSVWRQASQWLYTQSGEQMPEDWSRHAALERFIPEKASIELVSKPPAVTPSSMTQPLPLARAKAAKATPIKPTSKTAKATSIKPASSNKSPPILAQASKKSASSKDAKKIASAKKSPSSTPANPSVYIVQEGDSLWKIAQRFGVKVDEIKKLNNLKSDALKKGTTLKLPKRVENSSLKTKS